MTLREGDLVKHEKSGREGWAIAFLNMEEEATRHEQRKKYEPDGTVGEFDDSLNTRVQWSDGTEEVVCRDDLEAITPAIYVNVYLVDRLRGGPEEGGWYYDAGSIEESLRCKDEAHAQQVYERKLAQYKEENKNRRSDTSSVLSEGRYDVTLQAWPGENWPAERPYYC